MPSSVSQSARRTWRRPPEAGSPPVLTRRPARSAAIPGPPPATSALGGAGPRPAAGLGAATAAAGARSTAAAAGSTSAAGARSTAAAGLPPASIPSAGRHAAMATSAGGRAAAADSGAARSGAGAARSAKMPPYQARGSENAKTASKRERSPRAMWSTRASRSAPRDARSPGAFTTCCHRAWPSSLSDIELGEVLTAPDRPDGAYTVGVDIDADGSADARFVTHHPRSEAG